MAKRTRLWLRVILLAGVVWLLGGSLLLSANPYKLATNNARTITDTLLDPCWGERHIVATTAENSRLPTIAVGPTDHVHIVWEEGRYLFHSYWNGNKWSIPWRVTIGEQPKLAIDRNGTPHLVFVNEFRGKYEVYYCQWTGTTWSLPRNVSSTSGVSAIPDIAIDSRNTLHVVWTDNSPGYNVIYHGFWTGTFWINRPIPHARGSVPAIAIGDDDLLHVVWQDRNTIFDPYEIYHVQWDGVDWSLPENLSDSDNHSTIPDVQVTPNGITHVTWEERVGDQEQIYYCGGTSFLWSIQEAVSTGSANAYLPTMAVDAFGFVHLAWDASDYLAHRWHLGLPYPWMRTQCIAENAQGIADVALAAGPDGSIHAAWAERVSESNWDIVYGRQPSVFQHQRQIPLLLR